ncbi:chromosome partitioning protein ParA [Caballeronia sp. S22]|uniref:McrB family protein n=1 Tax=Caballeronia sp. S22 TaxID=3137182 RepID=UPI0035315D15
MEQPGKSATDTGLAEQERRASDAEQERRALDAERQRIASDAEQGRRALDAERQRLALDAEQERRAIESEHERLMALEDRLNADVQALRDKTGDLDRREREVREAERLRDTGFADARRTLQAELHDKRTQAEKEIEHARETKLSEMQNEVAVLKARRLDEVSRAEQAERDRIRAEIDKERGAWTAQQDDLRKQFESERTELEKRKGALSALQSEFEGRKAMLEGDERTLERRAQRLEQQWQKRNEQLDDELARLVDEERKSLESQKQCLGEENTRLRKTITSQASALIRFDHLKRQLGDEDVAEVLRKINSQTDELLRLRDELAVRPTEEMRERYHQLEARANDQKTRADRLQEQVDDNEAAVAEVNELRRRNLELSAEKKSLEHRSSIFEQAVNEAQAELDRLRAAYERPADVAARYAEIEMPYVAAEKIEPPVKAAKDEMTWLANVGNECDKYGLHFNPRILKAFHTALKTAEWSPLTVLAGVSGTGKSELPRLYSHFGGIQFESISVQPNWDSQESMLGFFNSIDNKFDAQPVLRFLAQSQKEWTAETDDRDAYPGLSDALCLVLLDEMNLAHPELYFAEFLSKLELRRGRKGSEVPFLPVKIGAGLEPYKLKLGRNVLWAGTMNQDETTKSLSDKVIDRSIIIHFPRPTELKRRLKLAPLDETNRGPALHKSTWQRWLADASGFSEEEVRPFRVFIERINATLEVAGRAIGHRIWQSVEYYMANYPDVRAAQQAKDKDFLSKAMHIAFEDQLVQKVMPKLRGIDTRGKSKTGCLDKIRGQIIEGIGGNSFNLTTDFDLACELGYGQFIWQSANYLNAAGARPVVAAESPQPVKA